MSYSTAFSVEANRKLLISIATNNKIKVRWDNNCKVPNARSDGTITLFPPNIHNSDDFFHAAFHEVAHLLPKFRWSYDDLINYVNMQDKLIMTVANILLDAIVEEDINGKYEWIDLLQDKVGSKLIANHLDHINVTPPANAIESLMNALMCLDVRYRQFFNGIHTDMLDPTGAEKLNAKLVSELYKIHLHSRLHNIHHTDTPAKDFGNLILDILKLIGYSPTPTSQNPSPSSQAGKGEEGGEEDSEGQSKSVSGDTEDAEAEGMTPSDDDPTKLPEHSPPKGDKTFEEHGTEICRRLVSAEDHNNDHIAQPNDLNNLDDVIKNILNTPPIQDGWNRPDMEEFEIHDGSYSVYQPHKDHAIYPIYKSTDDVVADYVTSIGTALGNSTVSKQISKYLKVMNIDTYSFGQTNGKIHSKNIHRVLKPNSPGQKPRVFKKKNGSLLKEDSAVLIMSDCSGSMSGSKYSIAAACCVALTMTLQDLNIPVEVLGFSEYGKLKTYEFKPFGYRATKDKMIRALASTKVDMSFNADGESLVYGIEKLLNRKENKKLMVVLSDGRPTGGYSGDPDIYLKEITKRIEEIKNVDLIGIGINTTSVERYYKHCRVVSEVGELDKVLFSVLKDFLV